MNYYRIVQTKILPKWYVKNHKDKKFTLLIVGCNSGEDIYNFAILLSEFKSNYKNFDFQILAVDDNSSFIEISKRAIYPEDSIKEIPMRIKKKYFLKSKNRQKKLVKISPELRKKVQFRKIDSLQSISFRERMDIIKINRQDFVKLPIIKKLINYFDNNGYLITNGKNFLIHYSSKFQEIFPNVYYLK